MSKTFDSTSFTDRLRSSGQIGSVSGTHSSCSSNQNSDNDEDSDARSAVSYKERRREAHTYAEQKRRDAIKNGYENLRTVIPACQQVESPNASKISKASILQKSIEYITYLTEHNENQEATLDKLRRDVMALKIMKANYEHIVKTHNNSPPTEEQQLPEEIKFRLFQQMMDNLFLSFDHSTSVDNFAELSACVFSWLEEYCKPQNMRQLMLAALHHVTSELQ